MVCARLLAPHVHHQKKKHFGDKSKEICISTKPHPIPLCEVERPLMWPPTLAASLCKATVGSLREIEPHGKIHGDHRKQRNSAIDWKEVWICNIIAATISTMDVNKRLTCREQISIGCNLHACISHLWSAGSCVPIVINSDVDVVHCMHVVSDMGDVFCPGRSAAILHPLEQHVQLVQGCPHGDVAGHVLVVPSDIVSSNGQRV
mmetsp:Transcript_88748/g.147451  ORF Transcript_88748/g.147451 Transcript_88748/m.147451 type:complete len:204 (+) Transcript_88748:822-1433(+)